MGYIKTIHQQSTDHQITNPLTIHHRTIISQFLCSKHSDYPGEQLGLGIGEASPALLSISEKVP